MTPFDRSSEVRALFSRYNKSELYQIARDLGYRIPPQTPSAELVELIINTKPPAAEVNPHDMDEWRAAIIRFLLDHRRGLETQVTCPAKALYTDEVAALPVETVVEQAATRRMACFGCVDAQVVNCIVSNGNGNQQRIQQRKKTGSLPQFHFPGENDMSDPTIQMAPRDLESLKMLSPFKMRLLLSAMGQLNDPAQMQAFHSSSTQESKAQMLFKLLQEYDIAHPGEAPPPAAPAPVAQPMQQLAPPPAVAPVVRAPVTSADAAVLPHTNGVHPAASVMQPHTPAPQLMPQMPPAMAPLQGMMPGLHGVQPMTPMPQAIAAPIPSGVAAAQAATEPETRTRAKRTPAASGDVGLGAEVVAKLSAALELLQGDKERFTSFRNDVIAILNEASGSKSSALGAVEQKLDNLLTTVQYTHQLAVWSFLVLLTMAENPGTPLPRVDLVRMVMSAPNELNQLIAAAQGKV